MNSKIIINNYFQHFASNNPFLLARARLHLLARWAPKEFKLQMQSWFWDEFAVDGKCSATERSQLRRSPRTDLRRIKNLKHISKKNHSNVHLCTAWFLNFSCILHIFFHLWTNIQSPRESLVCIQKITFRVFLVRTVKTLKLISQKKTLQSILLHYFAHESFMSDSRWFCFSFLL